MLVMPVSEALMVTIPADSGDTERFVHQGLSLKSFERKFILNNDLKVDSVELVDGLLTIALSKTPNSNRKVLEIN